MELGLAGALSGAGQAGTNALSMAQAQMGNERLQKARDEMENLRLEKTMAAADRRGERDIAARAEESRLGREQQERIQGKGFEHAEGMQDKSLGSAERMQGKGFEHAEGMQEKTIAAQEKVAGMGTASHEKIAKDSNALHKQMNADTNAMHLKVAQIQKEMHEKQYDKTFTAARLGALKDTVRELGNEITRLSVISENPMADKSSPSYKAMLIQLESATKLHNLYSKQVGLEAGVGESAITDATTKKELPAFKSPSMSQATPQPAPKRSGGMVQTPSVSPEEEARMEAALELQKRGR